MRLSKKLAPVLFLSLAWGCSGDDGPPEPEPRFQYVIDDSVVPVVDELGSYDDQPRPVTGMADSRGTTGSFVAAELIVADDGTGLRDEVAERYGAEVLAQLEAPEGLEMPTLYLLRIELERAPERFAAQVDELADEAGIHPGADWRFADEAAVKTFAASIAEQAAGHRVTLNWVGEEDAIPDFTEEGDDYAGGYHDAYTFDWLNRADREESLKMGVPEAWSLMHLDGSLLRGIRIAVIDSGFDPHGDALGRENLDFGEVEAFSTHPRHSDPLSGAGTKNWHGQQVASTAFARQDNQFGSVGVAGPVIGRPLLVYSQLESFAAAEAVTRSHARGADIINMSFRIKVPAIGRFVVLPLTVATSTVRDAGTLIFGSAGNKSDDVDGESCFGPLICWEDWYHAPCEDPGVVCVGGLAAELQRHPNSNYGDDDVWIYAPYEVDVGPYPTQPAPGLHGVEGTSFSSPFTAGAAGLVWTADPSLSADAVWEVLRETARGPARFRRLDVYAAVLRAIGLGFRVSIDSPPTGTALDLGSPTTFVSTLHMYAEWQGAAQFQVRWTSDIDGLLHEEFVTIDEEGADDIHTAQTTMTASLSEGTHRITIEGTAISAPWTNHDLITSSDQVEVTVGNTPPQVTLVSPGPGESFCEGESTLLRAEATDLNETLTESAYEWSYGDITPSVTIGAGSTRTHVFPVGLHDVFVRVTDSSGGWDEATERIQVLPSTDPACAGNQEPTAIIAAPASGRYPATGADGDGAYLDITLEGDFEDPDDALGDMTFEWYSDIQGNLGTGQSIDVRLRMDAACELTHHIRLLVTDDEGANDDDVVAIEIYVVC